MVYTVVSKKTLLTNLKGATNMAANQSSARIHNKKEIIDTLMREGQMSRAGLAKKLELSKPATAENVEGLIQSGLVFEAGEGNASREGGRKPRLLGFNSCYRMIVVVDLNLRRPMLALGDLSGKIISQSRLKISSKAGPEEKISAMLQAVEQLLEEAGDLNLGMIVLSSPGIYNENNQLVYAHPQHGWANIGLDRALTEYFGVPAVIKNDMSVAVLGELELGSGAGCRNMVYISCGVGLGAGIVIEGKLYEGKNFAAGELSYFTDRNSYEQGIRIEEQVTIEAVLEQTEEDINAGRASERAAALMAEKGSLEFEDLVTLINEQDIYMTEKIAWIGQELGFIISNINALLDIERIVIGGEYLEFFDILKEQIGVILNRTTVSAPELLPSMLGNKAGLQGGFIFGRERLFSNLEL